MKFFSNLYKKPLTDKELFQVSYEIEYEKTFERELKSILLALEEFNILQGTIITCTHSDTKIINNKRITFLPLWEWSLL